MVTLTEILAAAHPEEQMVAEKILAGEILFGFELEGIIPLESLVQYGMDENLLDLEDFNVLIATRDEDVDIRDVVADIPDWADDIRRLFPLDHILEHLMARYYHPGEVVDDHTIVPNDASDYSFEFRSPPLPITPAAIKKVERLLGAIKRFGVYTNQSCGFHIHFGLPALDQQMTRFVVASLAADPRAREMFGKLNEIDFFHAIHATTESLDAVLDQLRQGNVLFTTEKTSLFHLHPQGTLEWRGPRNFLHVKNGISDFLKMVLAFTQWMINVISEKKPITLPGDPPVIIHYRDFSKSRDEITIRKADDYVALLMRRPFLINMKASLGKFIPDIRRVLARQPVKDVIAIINAVENDEAALRLTSILPSFPHDDYLQAVMNLKSRHDSPAIDDLIARLIIVALSQGERPSHSIIQAAMPIITAHPRGTILDAFIPDARHTDTEEKIAEYYGELIGRSM